MRKLLTNNRFLPYFYSMGNEVLYYNFVKYRLPVKGPTSIAHRIADYEPSHTKNGCGGFLLAFPCAGHDRSRTVGWQWFDKRGYVVTF